jgi:WD40 repeat protein
VTECPPIALLERLLAGQLAGGEEELLSAHVESCECCAQVLERLTTLRLSGAPGGHGLGRLRALLPTEPAAEPPPTSAAGWPDVPDYEILGELGRGGMGIVYKARQTSLGRVVALKMVSAERATGDQLARFRAEAETAARLQHPNIIAVYEVGAHGGRPYFAMEFVQGGTLEQRLVGQPLLPREAAGLVRVLARAVQHAHSCGVVHRDLKPANILLQRAGGGAPSAESNGKELCTLHSALCTPKLADFGLAKRLQADLRLTDTGDILGTPSYMAPEQVRGEAEVGPSADIYALGATLYAMLSGRPPFLGATPLETAGQVAVDEPLPPRRLQPSVPRDLEATCLKCLEKDPRRRYATAGALADDLGRFLDGRPTVARPVGPAGRAWRWARRRPTRAAAYALALLALVFGLGGGGALALWQRAEEARRGAEQAAGEAREARGLADAALLREGEAREKLDQVLYLRRVQLAHREWLASNIPRWRQYLDECDPRRRGWEWYYVDRLSRPLLELRAPAGPAPAVVCGLAYSPDGTRLATADLFGPIRLWDARTGQELFVLEGTDQSPPGQPFDVTFTPDGKRVAAGRGQRAVAFWDAGTGKRVASVEVEPPQRIGCLALSPNGDRLAVGVGRSNERDPRVRLWDTETGRGRVLTGPAGSTNDVAFGPDGKLVAAAADGGEVTVWDADTGAERAALKGHAGPVWAVAFRPPGGKQVASCGADGTVRLWDVGERREVFTLQARAGAVDAVAFSPDGRSLAAGNSNGTITIWDPTTGEQRAEVKSVEVRRPGPTPGSPVGAVPLGSTGGRSTILVMAQGTGHRLAGVRALGYSPDGRLLASSDPDGVVRVWDMTSDPEATTFRLSPPSSLHAALSADGRRFALATTANDVRLFDLDARKQTAVLKGHAKRVLTLAFSPDGEGVVTAGDDKTVRVWNPQTGRERRRFGWDVPAITAVALAPAGSLLAAGGTTGEVKVWDLTTGHEVLSPRTITQVVVSLAFSPDGRLLAAGGAGGTVEVWHTGTGQKAFATSLPHGFASPLTFSRDGRFLAAANGTGAVRVFEATSGRMRSVFGDGRGPLLGLAFSSSGERLAAVGADVTMWDWSAGQEALTFREPTGGARAVAFGSGERLTVANPSGWVRVWDPGSPPAR